MGEKVKGKVNTVSTSFHNYLMKNMTTILVATKVKEKEVDPLVKAKEEGRIPQVEMVKS